MTYAKLRQHAPEAQNLTTCIVCGLTDQARVTGHVLVGQPGTEGVDGGVCEACGKVLVQATDTLGANLALDVEESQQHAGGHEITVHQVPKP